MSYSLAISKKFTAHQNKDAHSSSRSWATDHLYFDYKEQSHVLDHLQSSAERNIS